MEYTSLISTRWLGIYANHPSTLPKQGKFHPKRILRSQTHCATRFATHIATHFAFPNALPNAFCNAFCNVFCNAFCVPQRIWRPPTHLSSNMGVVLPKHLSLTNAFGVHRRNCRPPAQLSTQLSSTGAIVNANVDAIVNANVNAFVNAFVVHSDYKRAAAPSIDTFTPTSS